MSILSKMYKELEDTDFLQVVREFDVYELNKLVDDAFELGDVVTHVDEVSAHGLYLSSDLLLVGGLDDAIEDFLAKAGENGDWLITLDDGEENRIKAGLMNAQVFVVEDHRTSNVILTGHNPHAFSISHKNNWLISGVVADGSWTSEKIAQHLLKMPDVTVKFYGLRISDGVLVDYDA